MKTSAELRWFWRDAPPDRLRDWFRDARAHALPAGGGGTRVDRYLADPAQPELGIKLRGGGEGEGEPDARGPVEVKGLVAREFGSLDAGAFRGPLQLWTKWRSEALSLDGARLIRTAKRRWLRTFALVPGGATELELDRDENVVGAPSPDVGCSVELTEVTVADGVWWTLAFESFGPLDTLEPAARAAAVALAARRPPDLPGGTIASYPEWLSRP